MIRDAYDLAHEETGSGNIAKATPEWRSILATAREDPSDEEYVLHQAYKLINKQVAAGIAWSKCMNCGSPFLGLGEHCSNGCFDELLEDLNASSW